MNTFEGTEEEFTRATEGTNNNIHSSQSGFCCGRSLLSRTPTALAPDADFHADSLITLSYGLTAYRLIEPKFPKPVSEEQPAPVIVCLHGLTNASYMWGDVSDLLADFEQGPQATVLVFDFYGHGRSPWAGTDITLDTLVGQTKELLDCE